MLLSAVFPFHHNRKNSIFHKIIILHYALNHKATKQLPQAHTNKSDFIAIKFTINYIKQAGAEIWDSLPHILNGVKCIC